MQAGEEWGDQVCPGEAADVKDDAAKIDAAISCGVERLVYLLRMLAEWRRSTCGLGRILRQREVFDHQGRRKAGLVVVIRGRGRHRARHRTIRGQRPALSRRSGCDVK